MNAFITGASGFIGKHLTEKVKSDFNVFCLSRKKIEDKKIKVIIGDITDKASYEVPDDCYVFHLASRIMFVSRQECFRVNYEGTKNLLEACKRKNVKKFVYFSSADVFGEVNKFPLTEETPCCPTTNYARSKLRSEKIVLEYNQYFPTVVLRPPTVYGPGNNTWQLSAKIFQQVKRGWFPVIGEGDNLKEFCFVKNLVEGALLCAQKENTSGKIYLLSDERPYTFREIILQIAAVMQINLRIISLPYFVGQTLCRVSTTFKKLCSDFYFDISRAKNELNYLPRYTLREGILETVRQIIEI